MRGKILFLAGAAVGYVLGTRAGRERYEQISAAASKLWQNPQVQQRVDQVEDFVRDKAPDVAEFVGDNAKKLVSQVAGKKAPAKRAPAKRTPSRSSGSSGAAKSSS